MAAAPQPAVHPQGVRLVLKNATRAWLAPWDAAWVIPAPTIAGKQVTYTFAVGSLPVNTPCTINWGDGQTTTHTVTGASLGVSHTYAAAGTYTIRVQMGPSRKMTTATVA